MDILIKRGVEAKRATVTPQLGEPIMTTDEKELYIGDGSTAGGIPVGTVKPSGSIVANMIALFTDTTGKVLKGISKSDFLQGYATESWVTQKIAGDSVNIKINNAKHADTAGDAHTLNGVNDFLRPSVITQSYQENNANKVGSAKALKALYDAVVGLINGVKSAKVDKSAISNSITSTSGTAVASSLAVKTVNDKASQAQTAANSVKQTATSALSTAQQATNLANGVKSDLVSVKATADAAKSQANTNKAHLSRLPKAITSGTGTPSNSTGSEGDIYVQYK